VKVLEVSIDDNQCFGTSQLCIVCLVDEATLSSLDDDDRLAYVGQVGERRATARGGHHQMAANHAVVR